jgi:hypothetical protein
MRAVRLALLPDAVFHTPVADYRGLDEIAPVLDTLLRVLRVTSTVAMHGDDTENICFFRAEVEGKQADGSCAWSRCRARPPARSP